MGNTFPVTIPGVTEVFLGPDTVRWMQWEMQGHRQGDAGTDEQGVCGQLNREEYVGLSTPLFPDGSLSKLGSISPESPFSWLVFLPTKS